MNLICNVCSKSTLLTWWRHQMANFSALLALCAGNPSVPVNSPHKGQWRRALMFSLICARINDWVYNREAGDLRRHRGHCDVNVMWNQLLGKKIFAFMCNTIWGRVAYTCVIGPQSSSNNGLEPNRQPSVQLPDIILILYRYEWKSVNLNGDARNAPIISSINLTTLLKSWWLRTYMFNLLYTRPQAADVICIGNHKRSEINLWNLKMLLYIHQCIDKRYLVRMAQIILSSEDLTCHFVKMISIPAKVDM